MKDKIKFWNGRRYYSLDAYLKNTFGEKLYKLSLNGGMSCPNRDGKISYGGCIFCSSGGSGEFAADSLLDINKQVDYAKSLILNKFSGNRFIAYFQAYTNTYASVDYLENLFMPVVERGDIAVLSIATRPDCIEKEKLELIGRLAKIKPIWVELGLQTMHKKTAELINRGYDTECYDLAVKKLKDTGAKVITHMIIGLPFETKDEIIETARYIGTSGADGIKLQLMHVLEGTKLAEMYRNGDFNVLSEADYISLVTDIISILPEDIVIHRLTGDGDKKILIAPKWSGDKRHIINSINHKLKIRNLYQGSFFEYNNAKLTKYL